MNRLAHDLPSRRTVSLRWLNQQLGRSRFFNARCEQVGRREPGFQESGRNARAHTKAPLLCLLLGCAAITVVACASPSWADEEYDRTIDAATKAIESGELDRGIRLATRCIQMDPSWAGGYF